uniref:Uncharacterized protein n=1 Tax=Clastoptera arizonana TaxID=38151 RepID=A0A1B6C9L7_9HEMI
MFFTTIFFKMFYIILLYICLNISSLNCQYNSINVKTVLFRESDLSKKCWCPYDINLLSSRKVFQDLIPKLTPTNFPLMLKYFKVTEETIIKFTQPGYQRETLIFAFYDVIGGYLQSIAIPMAKESFYAGNTNYDTMNQLIETLKQIKIKLETDGRLWSRPISLNKSPTHVVPLELELTNPDQACNHLATRNFCPSIPYLDDDIIPGAVAIPLRAQNLFSLMRPGSSHVLVRYYMLVMQCMSNSTEKEILAFNHKFHEWIIIKVVPHLYEQNRWYPGFGSIMRIIKTMDHRGLSSNAKYQRRIVNGSYALEESLFNSTCGYSAKAYTLIESRQFLGAIFIFVLTLLFIFCFCCCYWCITKKQEEYKKYIEANGKDTSKLNAAFSVYCGLKDYSYIQPGEILITENPSYSFQKMSFNIVSQGTSEEAESIESTDSSSYTDKKKSI